MKDGTSRCRKPYVKPVIIAHGNIREITFWDSDWSCSLGGHDDGHEGHHHDHHHH